MLDLQIDEFSSLASCLIGHVIRIVLYFLLYLAGIILLRIAYRLRYQVFNWDLKQQPTSDQAVLITGATSGIGLALVRHCHKRGYTVIAGYDVKGDPGYEELLKLNEKGKLGNSIYLIEINVRSEESVIKSHELVKKILEANNLHLRALVNNAVYMYFQRAMWTSHQAARAMIETNLLGTILMTRQYLPQLIKSPNGRVISISSISSLMPFPYGAIYGATKCGLSYYTNSLVLDMKKNKISAVSLHPGLMMKNKELAKLISETRRAERSRLEFSNEEKELYGAEFKEDEDRLDKYLDSSQRAQEVKRNLFQRSKEKFLDLIDMVLGSVGRDVKFEESHFIDNFDNAISLKSPPGEMFTGNIIYNTVIHAGLESFSHALRTNLVYLLGMMEVR